MTSQGTVAKYLSEEGLGERARRCRWKFYKRLEEPEGKANQALYFLAFLFEMVGIQHDAPTFNTANLAEFVLLLRDTIGDHATVGTGAWPIHSWELWINIWDVERHGGPPEKRN